MSTTGQGHSLKGRVSIRGFSWYLNISIIFWKQIATYRGHALLKTSNQMELWFFVYHVLTVGGVSIFSPTGGNKLAIYNLTIIDHLAVLAYIA